MTNDKPYHYSLFCKLFINDEQPSLLWRRLSLSTKSKRWPTLRSYILSSVDSHQYGEFIYLLTHNWEYPICPVCGKALSFNHGYKTYCSRSCARSAQDMTKLSTSRKTNRAIIDSQTTIDKANLSAYDDIYLPIVSDDKQLIAIKTGNEYADIRYWLSNRIPWASHWSETIYCLQHNIIKRPCCAECGKPVAFRSYKTGYNKYCSPSCINKDDVTRNKISIANTINAKERGKKISAIKQKRTKEQIAKEHALSQQTRLARYGDANYSNHKAARQTNIRRYGHICPLHAESIKGTYECNPVAGYHTWWNSLSDKEKHDHYIKINNTKRKNNSFNVSVIEEELSSYILSLFPDMIRQYRSQKYPFACDYYIPSIDTYIELQGSWTHGGHPYMSEDSDVAIAMLWQQKALTSKYYKNALYTWTTRDVQKRTIAKQNGLNFYELWGTNIRHHKQTIKDIYKNKQ